MRFWGVVKIAVGVVALCFGLILADRYRGHLVAWVRPSEPPSKTGPLPLGGEIADARERRLVNSVSQEYDRVKLLVDAARGKGEDVATLDQMLVFSVTLARQKRYD